MFRVGIEGKNKNEVNQSTCVQELIKAIRYKTNYKLSRKI